MDSKAKLADMIRVGMWAQRLGHLPDTRSIREEFGGSLARAHRWRTAIADAWGVPRPPKGHCYRYHKAPELRA